MWSYVIQKLNISRKVIKMGLNNSYVIPLLLIFKKWFNWFAQDLFYFGYILGLKLNALFLIFNTQHSLYLLLETISTTECFFSRKYIYAIVCTLYPVFINWCLNHDCNDICRMPRRTVWIHVSEPLWTLCRHITMPPH